MERLWTPAALLLAAIGGAASTRAPWLAVGALGGLVAFVPVSWNRVTATAVLLPLCILPYAVSAGGLQVGPSDVLLLLVGAALLLEWTAGDEPGPLLGPLAVPAVGFVLWTGMSVAWADDATAVLVDAAQRAAFVLVGMAVVRALPADGVAIRRALVTLVTGTAVLGAATAVTGVLQGRLLHVYALGMHKNWLGFVLSFGFVTLVAIAFELHRPRSWLLFAGAVPIILGLAMSGSRGGWIGALAGSAVVVILRRPALGWPALTASTVVIALLFVAAPGLTTERIDVSTPDTSAGMRLRTWSSGIEAIRERPVLGHGAGNFRAMIKDRGSQVDPNNLTLLTWAETGVLGLLLLAWLVGGAVRLALQNSAGDSARNALANSAGAAIVVAAMTHAQFDMFWLRGISLATFMAIGLILWSTREHGTLVEAKASAVKAIG